MSTVHGPRSLSTTMCVPPAGARARARARARGWGRSKLVLLAIAALASAGGCGSDKDIPRGAASVGLAILSSDYAVTTVTLYDPVTERLVDDCVRTSDAVAVLAQPLSGDVVLPGQAQHGGELILIDRKNSVLTFVDPTSCTPRAQLSVSTGGFKANPRDVVSVSAHKAYVTRYESNPMPTDDPLDLDEGDDVLVFDPLAVGSSEQPILKRIPLADYATSVGGSVIHARPDRGVLVRGKVYLTLGNLDQSFAAAGAGRIVVIDTATDEVSGVIDLADVKGCSAVEYVEATNRLYVSCGGAFSDSDQAAASALVEVDLSGGTPAVRRMVRASAVGGLPINFSYAAILGDTAYVGTLGALDLNGALLSPDALYAVRLATGEATKLLDGGAYNFGRVTVDPARKRVLLPDGDAVTPRVRIFDASVDPPVAAGDFEANPFGRLPPREIAWY